MTIASRRLARRCRERFSVNPDMLPRPSDVAAPTTVGSDTTDGRREKVDATK
ncbi:hypothetical protein CLV71_103379 [Actinophytocola oryzae]|uniref:Uncharacterized protein n=1 Tax=Actinophytocola oryzae TaxID=502181 RepID=A0A4R7VZP2_9PSEU|nr:hypothetical protein CLV71_103379 [Actinophytocola oryzae]